MNRRKSESINLLKWNVVRSAYSVVRSLYCALRTTCYVLLAMLCFSGTVLAQDTGPTVTGDVMNGTPDGDLPQNTPVTLQFFAQGMWTNIYTTTLSGDGTFRFESLDGEVGNDFVTQMTYKDVSYFSEPMTLAESGNTETTLLIFEPTNDPATVRVDQAHFFIVPAGDRVHMAEYYMLGNGGDRAYVGTPDPITGERTTLSFSLPPGAENLSFENGALGERYQGDESQFSDTQAILPGTATIEVSFRYEMAYQEGMELQRSVAVPIESVVFIISSESIGLSGEGMEFKGVMDTQMGHAASYIAGPLDADELLKFRFVQQTQPLQSMTPTTPDKAAPHARAPSQEVGIGIVALALSGLVSTMLWQPRASLPMPDLVQPLVEQIAALDARFEDGHIIESDYQHERATLKRRLREKLESLVTHD